MRIVPAIALRTVIFNGVEERLRGQLVRTTNGYLFHGRDLLDIFAIHIAAMLGEIEELEAEQFLSIAPDALLADLASKYQIEPAALNCSECTLAATLSPSSAPHEHGNGKAVCPERPTQTHTVQIPFTGNRDLFQVRPTSYLSSPPAGETQEMRVVLVWDFYHSDSSGMRAEVDRVLGEIEQYLSWIREDVEGFNRRLPGEARAAIRARRARLGGCPTAPLRQDSPGQPTQSVHLACE